MKISTELSKVEKSAKEIATLVYVLQAASLLIGITVIVAVIVNYVKKTDVQNTFVASHFRWQIRTFWFSLLWGIIGFISSIIIIGWFILLANAIWFIYRFVRGWLTLNDNKPMYISE